MTEPMPNVLVNYPADLPLPEAEPYDWSAGLGLTAIRTNGGNTLIRRRWKHLPHTFNFTFGMTTDEMTRFVVFADTVGTDWFNIISLSMYTGADDTIIGPQPVRIISGLEISARGFNWWGIQVVAELSPDVYNLYRDLLGNNWIIGGSPSAPSANWIVARTPANPSPDWVVAGTPAAPSGWI